jgi:oligoribonuclease (3'-5' exoribonuclease)
MEKYIAFDVETGGLDTGVNSLLSVYFVVFDRDFKVLGELDLKIKPDKGDNYIVTAEALAINKIDLVKHNADQSTLTLSQAKAALYSFLQAHNPEGKTKLIPVGHNVYFDQACVWAHLISKATWHKFCSYRLLDTGVILQFLKLTGHVPVTIPGSLSSIIEHFNIPVSGELHEAKTDTVATVKVLRALLKTASRKG